MNSVVLWYDIGRQGATNESMSLSPILKDLSGNGNDATCYNFGWSGMSGIGGYNFSNFQELPNRSIYTKEGYKFNFTEKLTITNNFFNLLNCLAGGEVKVKINGLTDSRQVVFGSRYDYLLDNGEHTIIIPEGMTIYPFGVTGNQGDIDVTIEFLPQYPNALVSDGVNDYCLVQDKYDDEGNLINKKSLVLNKEDGYTVIAKRKWINPPINGEDISHGVNFVSKRKTSDTGAFVTELYNSVSKTWMCRSFSGNIAIDGISSEDIIYQTSTSYNGQFPLSTGDWDDSDTLYISSLMDSGYYANLALYSLILFNRDLTDEEIEWVKTNLIETEQ